MIRVKFKVEILLFILSVFVLHPRKYIYTHQTYALLRPVFVVNIFTLAARPTLQLRIAHAQACSSGILVVV